MSCPDLVILDLHMPRLDGFAVLEQVKQFAVRDYLPVLVLTADTTAAASDRALSAGAEDFVTKTVQQQRGRPAGTEPVGDPQALQHRCAARSISAAAARTWCN